ncbi:hypothetical protein FRC04_005617 [Tulasnella sp. 424]|nr:hypothetical protein FRC04_005617 [Tulasnella sp. 424]KAG8961846.1 hypothetical protein FRC05_005678 [Tulasnella sp. 425]
MATDPQAFWQDQHATDYLKQELEFLNAFTIKVVKGNTDTQSYPETGYSPARHFLGVVLAAADCWKQTVSPTIRENEPEKPSEEELQQYSEEDVEYFARIYAQNYDEDCNDSTYQVDWTPTSLYQWTYLNFKSELADLANDELEDELVLRSQYYDAELFDSGFQNAYPLAEDLLSPPSSPSSESVMSTEPAYIHQLPPEILSGIFILAHNGVLYFPIIISHVDSCFRKTAESTALLWTTIDVNLPLPIIRIYLKNSNTALLDVRINLLDGGGRRNASSRLSAFLAEVAHYRERIISLSMLSLNPQPVDEMVKAMLTGPDSAYPHLRILDTGCLRCIPTWVGQLELLMCPVLAPLRVEELCLRGYRSRDWVLGFPELRPGLKRLHLANNLNLFHSDLILVLSKLPDLEVLTIESCTIAREPLATWPTLVLPNLTTLQYIMQQMLNEGTAGHIQQVLVTPKLTSLKAWWNFGYKGWFSQGKADALVATLQANPQLERLDLCNCVIEQPKWREVFSMARSLKYLRFRSCELQSPDLEPLWLPGVGSDAEGYLPHLEHLVMENVLRVRLTTENIKQIVMHRPNLQSVELRGWDGSNIAEDDVKFLRQSIGYFVLETFNGGPSFHDEEEDEENEEWSSWGTPSEGSLLSGDEEVVSMRLVIPERTGNGQLENLHP